MADTYLHISGLGHLAGQQVSVQIGGIDGGDLVVDSTGSIYYVFGSDAGGITTPAYVASLSPYTGEGAATVAFDAGLGTTTYTIPLVVGQSYDSRLQVLRPVIEAEVKSPVGSAIGQTRRVSGVAIALLNTIAVNLGTTFSNLLAAFGGVEDANADNNMFTGIYYMKIRDQYSLDGMVCAQLNRPGPLTVKAIGTYVETEER